jgi:hypothetical protein
MCCAGTYLQFGTIMALGGCDCYSGASWPEDVTCTCCCVDAHTGMARHDTINCGSIANND